MRQRGPVRSFDWVEWECQVERIRVLLQRRGVEPSNSDADGVRQ
jgi:hypothetical protein